MKKKGGGGETQHNANPLKPEPAPCHSASIYHQALTHEVNSHMAPPICYNIPVERYLHNSHKLHNSVLEQRQKTTTNKQTYKDNSR